MTRLALAGWAAVAPGLEAGDAGWSDWAANPEPFPKTPFKPDVKFLPAMQRRRCDDLSRMMLAAANSACDETTRSQAASVFASRHGSFGTTVSMLEALARDEALSPTAFSHSVHNTQAGLFSIWTGNQAVAQSLAARGETFENALVEVACLSARDPARPVLFVTGDEALPQPVGGLSSDPHPPYAVALLLRGDGAAGDADGGFDLELEPVGTVRALLAWPPALEFVRWWLSDESELRLGSRGLAFVLRR